MSRIGVRYNERSWAIDLIGCIKELTKKYNRSIRDAGGEQTIQAGGNTLFPDVLLFGDRATTRILQGWELKMPDTSIDDDQFRQNAETKARALGLDSFLLWNVSFARLYILDAPADTYHLKVEWSDLSDVTRRASVVANRVRWERLAEDILVYLNDQFDAEALEGRRFIEAYQSGGITSLILENTGLVAHALQDAAKRDPAFRAEMTLWWAKYRSEYIGTEMEAVLAQAVISNWIGKILFAHILREKDERAHRIGNIDEATTPTDALALFRKLSQQIDFSAIFSNSLGLYLLPEKPWHEIRQLNRLLMDLRVGSVDQSQLSGILEGTVEVAKRKLRGQYPTPMALARLLVRLCVRNIVSDRILDPCCGSGTIARAALEMKLRAAVAPEDASRCVFAGDQDPQACQLAAFGLAKPSLMNIPIRVFQEDAFGLTHETRVELRDPSNGERFEELLGKFHAISCNLPFVAQAGRSQYGAAIRNVTARLNQDGQRISGRADVAAYLPFALHSVLGNGGRLGIIITNAWLGTEWGDSFLEALNHYYDLKHVITSGAGRWFTNSDVVANILILEKKLSPRQGSGSVSFVVLRRPLEELVEEKDQEVASAQIELGQAQFETMTIRSVEQDTLACFREYGLGGNAQFVNCDWVLRLPLVPLSDHFVIRRGERRGMNRLFYPNKDHGIEDEYIRPLAKSPTDFTRLVGPAAREAFSCSRSEEELRALGHHGALCWIARFRSPSNIEKLGRGNMYWYEMKADTLAELVMFINYGDRLFAGRLNPPAFIDQRMVRLEPRGMVDMDLCHALLNSSIGMFMMEGLGFGRGLGALDLSKDRIEAYMNILDPARLGRAQRAKIKQAFLPLLEREVFTVEDELEQADRREFDDTVIETFGLDVLREDIHESLRTLVGIRLAASA